MNNKCHNSCDWNFVPVSGNWDFNMDREPCQQPCPQRTQRQSACGQYSACAQQTPPARETTACACRAQETACETQSARETTCDNTRSKSMPAMVSIGMQQLGDLFQPEGALLAGTLYPVLHKPMKGYAPCAASCCDRKQAAAFAAWELRLYLNTHPDDGEALALFQQLCRALGESYATAFLPEGCADRWAWIRDPWPWEYDSQYGNQ